MTNTPPAATVTIQEQSLNADASIRFRAATLSDEAWLRDRLPPDRNRGQSFVGRIAGHRRAAFVVAPPLDAYRPQGLGVAMHLEPTLDERSIQRFEQAMVSKAATVAAGLNLGPLYAWPPPETGSDKARRYSRLGFVAFNTLTIYEVEVERVRGELQRFAKRQARGASATLAADMIPLSRADPDAVLALWEQRLGPRGPMRSAERRRLIGEREPAFHPTVSRVAVHGSRVVGLCLNTIHTTGGNATPQAPEGDAEVLAVAPGHGDVLVPLMVQGFGTAAERGVRRVRFFANSAGRFTHRLAARCGGIVLSQKLQMRRRND